MAKFKKYSLRFVCMVSVLFTFVMALFYPIEQFKADVVTVSSNYHAGVFSFETLQGLSDNAVPVSVVGFESSINERFRDSNGDYLSMKVGNSYKVTVSLNVTEDIHCDVYNEASELYEYPSYMDHDVRFYLVFNGQRYEINRGGNLYSATFFVDGYGQNSYEIVCIRDMYINVSGWSDLRYFYYTYGVSANVAYTITEYSGADALDASDTVINNNISQGNQLQGETNDLLDDMINMDGDSSLDDMSNTEMNDLSQKEDDLLGEMTPDDAANNLEVSIDADSNAVIWDIINDFVTANSTVFGGFISVLSLGVISLILNR